MESTFVYPTETKQHVCSTLKTKDGTIGMLRLRAFQGPLSREETIARTQTMTEIITGCTFVGSRMDRNVMPMLMQMKARLVQWMEPWMVVLQAPCESAKYKKQANTNS